MLQTIREHAQGWLMRSVIAVIVLAFTFWGINGYFVGSQAVTAVATVNGVQITKEQLAVAYERLRRQTQIQYGSTHTITTKDELLLKLHALQTLTEIEALKQASIHDGFFISDRQIDNYLESMPEFQVDGRFSTQRFQEVLASTLLSTSDFFELIRTSLLIDQMRLGVLLTSFAVPEETTYTISLVNQERAFSYLVLSKQLFQAHVPPVSDVAIKTYYNANKRLFMTTEKAAVDYIELNLADIAKKIVPNDAALKAAYNDNINAYTEPMSWRLDGIEIPVSAEATPAERERAMQEAAKLAVSLSDEAHFKEYQQKYPLSVSLGSEFLTLNQLPETWQKNVVNLQKVSQLSKPILSSSGIVILKVLEVHHPKVQSFEAVKEKVKAAYVRQHAEEQFADLRDQLSELTYQHPDSLTVAATKLGIPIKTSTVFAKETAGTDIASHKKVRDITFSEDVLVMKNNSEVISLNAESAVVIHLKTHLKPTLLPLESVKKQIADKINSSLLNEQAKKVVTEDLHALQSGKLSASALATRYKQAWKDLGFVGRYVNKTDAAILELVFSLPRPLNQQATYGMTQLHNGSYVVVALNSVKDGTITDEKRQAVFAEQVQNSEGLLEYELLKLSLLGHAKIEITDKQ